MGKLCFSTSILLFIFFISYSRFYSVFGNASPVPESREALEIIIGGGKPSPASPPEYGGCPNCYPAPEPECPPPPPPPSTPSPPPLGGQGPGRRRRRRPRPPPSPIVLPDDLKAAIKVIQRFKKRISCDPSGIRNTWTGNNICRDKSKYKGFFCAPFPGDNKIKVFGVKFNGFKFNRYNPKNCSGQRPLPVMDFIEEFPKLVFFHANSNNFTGSIPFEIRSKNLPYLYELDLSNNGFKGRFPKAVLEATNLTFLDLRFNEFTGPLAPGVFQLDLDVLFLNNNQFDGYIPETLGKNRALYLTLANNKFTGPIPKTIGQASNRLVEVLLLNNQLSGCLPYEIGLLRKTRVFDASKNNLTGPIPHSFACLAKMEQMDLSFNHLYGPVPETLCKLSNLYKLTLKNNYFTQVGAECRKLIVSKVLDVSMNCILDLPGQRSADECKHFFSVHRSCPDERSLTYVPCDIYQSASEGASNPRPRPAMAPSPAYAALMRHRL